ncbi:circadian clock protein PASD1-like [Peromyscus eremicus]|uniref:circadian clock protein PASD1-like n=1 Tax=Peromyscus eremicus TaxID=42410 RepID=UPI0027DDAF91|nr:circadian clock protein PASD1-like [Peromyscus eremicus]
MERKQQQKKKVSFKCMQKPTQEDLSNLLKKLREMVDKVGNGPSSPRIRTRPARCEGIIASASTSSPSDPRGVLNVRTNFDQNEVPVFNTYEEFHKTVIQSFENISIILNIDGKVVFISQNVLPLLGHRPEDIMGKTLLNILLDEEKEEISQKIVLKLPLAQSVGNLIEFCCYVRRGNAGRDALDTYGHGDMYEGRDTYEYVKFILYLQDSYDESFVFFGNYGPNRRNIWSSTPRLLWEQQYYLVGTISVLRTKAESKHPVEIQSNVIVIESDDDTDIQHCRFRKRRKGNGNQRNCKAENLNAEDPQSVSEVEIIDIQLSSERTPLGLFQIRSPSQSSTCTIISVDTNRSPSTSVSSTEYAAAAFSPASSSDQGSTIDPKSSLEPVNMEFEVGSEFLLNDSQEEQASPEQGECNDKDVKKPLKEATGSNPKEHVIDVHDSSSDEDYCVIVKEIKAKKGPKIQKPIVDQGQEHQKIVETAPKCPSTVVLPVRPKAVVEPRVRRDLPACVVTEPRRPYHFQGPLLGESIDQPRGPRMRRTQVYDLSISRSFREEPPSYQEIEEEERGREPSEYELAQRIEMLRNLPCERPMAQQQMGQRQENRVYRPRDQVVTVTNNLRRFPINSFGNDNSAHPQSETRR